MSYRRHLLIDGDVLAFKAAAVAETAIEWEPGYWTWFSDEMEARDICVAEIDRYMEALDADGYTLCLTDDAHNFRKDILDSYKGNRKSKRPLVLKAIKEWMADEMGAMVRPTLEGDDILGILATWPKFRKKHGEPVIVSIDKDMKTVPCLYCRDLETGIVEVTQEDADDWHLIQTLAGDQTDGYKGCPGIGMDRASKIIAEPTILVPYKHTITRGKRIGEVEVRYRAEPTSDKWKAVVSHYEAAGLNEEAALQQARVARILRASDYDFKSKTPIMWSPDK
ncbi:exonuclease [Pyruvatibacter mobilis]|uniref:Exonuclease n=1 Tax=Pyruvatibacter mobilis TaxID=1712261 RepID=A0A845Q8D2_9HYPH|nr:exonuclease [Pyruvatibacter mobilis]NBG94490.1 exonuclease [Pyruvatibacter mobilis]QJD74010.1 exonuclease [Pyruvatibacter mobilis]GGD03344.1 hypothetical protein GCM10011587_03850 [Pyruvatibacter mobilis]